MHWTLLPTGGFTGIDWARPGATDGADPYLVWAEADQFAGYGGRQPRWLPIALELHPGVSISQLVAAASRRWLHVPPVYTSRAAPAGLSFCTARVRPAFFQHVAPGGNLHSLVKRLELGLPAGNGTDDPTGHTSGSNSAMSPGDRLLTGKVLGIIDDSLALAHTNFLDPRGRPRTAFFWRQDHAGKGSIPATMGYGHELTGADIHAAMQANVFGGMVDEGGVYIDLGLSTLGQEPPQGRIQFHALDTPTSHGTHVADLAAGPRTMEAQVANLPPGFDAPPSWAEAGDDASRCPLVAVQLDYDTVADTSGGSMNVHVLDGLMYILSRCAASAQVTVNVSFGTLAGPHDGTSLLEAAMDQLLALLGNRRLAIVIAAGNSYQDRTHANLTLRRGQSETLHWRVLPDDASQSFLELWLPPDAEGIELQITPPGRTALPTLRIGQSRMWLDGGDKPVCALIYPRHVATGNHGTCALLALAPSFSFKREDATAPAGLWEISLTNTRSGSVTIDAYVERDDVVIPARGGARQSHFEDRFYNTSGNPGDWVDHPDNPSLIRRSGNFNSIGTGSQTVSVGGTRIADGSWAHYSPRKPDPDASRPERPVVVKVPDTQAFSDENAALLGLKAAGTRSGGVARLAGTSDAAPQAARRILNRM